MAVGGVTVVPACLGRTHAALETLRFHHGSLVSLIFSFPCFNTLLSCLIMQKLKRAGADGSFPLNSVQKLLQGQYAIPDRQEQRRIRRHDGYVVLLAGFSRSSMLRPFETDQGLCMGGWLDGIGSGMDSLRKYNRGTNVLGTEHCPVYIFLDRSGIRHWEEE